MHIKGLPGSALLLLCLLSAVLQAHGAVWLYGDRVDAQLLKDAAHYNYAYLGRDWTTKVATCNGKEQSPIALDLRVARDLVPEGQQTTLSYGALTANGSDLVLKNDGHTVGLALADATGWKHNVSIAIRGNPATSDLINKFNQTEATLRRVPATPIGLHVHTPSEHLIGGRQFPLELHIVHTVDNATLPGCGKGSCLAVVGLLFEYGEEANPFIETIFSNMPTVERTATPLLAGTILNFSDILPADTTYITYPGSLTTPPCTQGVLWHVMQTPLTISRGQVAAIQQAMGDTECPDTKAPMDVRRRLMADSAAPAATPAAAALTKPGTASKAAQPLPMPYGSTDEEWVPPAAGPDGCKKLTNGRNARDVQPANVRPVWLYTAAKVCPGALGEQAAEALKAYSPNQLSVSTYEVMKELGYTVPHDSVCPANTSADVTSASTAAAPSATRSAAAMAGFPSGAVAAALVLAWAGVLGL